MIATKEAPKETPAYLSIIGPTASGKTGLAIQLAKELGGEIINSDSVQLYRGFDIGSAKPSLAERQGVVHHLLDMLHWDEPFDAGCFASLAQEKIRQVASQGKLPIVVGGSGLYLRSLWGERFHNLPSDPKLRAQLKSTDQQQLYERLKALDPQRAQEIHPHDHFRVARALEIILLSGQAVSTLVQTQQALEFAPRCILMLDPPREKLHEAIELRTQQMLDAGLVAEVELLLSQGCAKDVKVMQSIGYKQVLAYLEGQSSVEDLALKIAAATRQYAKRQMTWFKKIKADIHLHKSALTPELLTQVKSYFTPNPSG